MEHGCAALAHSTLVANAHECALLEAHLVCGYGFTAEPDFLYLLRASDGEVVTRVKLQSGPEHIWRKSDRLYVRSYDTDYVFAY